MFRPGTLLLLGVIALVVIGLRGRYDEVAAALPKTTGMSATATQAATVDQVTSGDTFVLNSGTKVRLLQVDAPQADECFGVQAKQWLANQLPPGTRVLMKRDPGLPEVDDAGRVLRYVYRADDTKFINQRLVQTGAGTPYFVDDVRGVHAGSLIRLAQVARKAPVGLWRVCEGTKLAPARSADTGPVVNNG